MPSRLRMTRAFAVPILLVIAMDMLAAPQQAGSVGASQTDHSEATHSQSSLSQSDHSQPQHSIGQRRKFEGVGNFGEVTPMLYRGAQPSHQGFQALARMGIDLVVDVRGTERASEGEEVRKLGMQYVSIPWHCLSPKDQTFVRFLQLVHDNPGKKIFVHCRLGNDRTGMTIAAYRMAAQGWSAQEALREMEAFGFTKVHRIMCPDLESYEKHFPEHLRTNPAFEGLRPPAEASR